MYVNKIYTLLVIRFLNVPLSITIKTTPWGKVFTQKID